MDKEKIKRAVRMIIEEIDRKPDRPDLSKTPERVANMYEDIFSGSFVRPEDALEIMLSEKHDEIVLVKDIPIYSMCEHHMLPFVGKAHVAYLPSKKVIGLSKIPRIVDMFARRLQVQERMTREIAEFLDEVLHPTGVAVVVEGAHMCSMMRGVKKANARMTTSSMLGSFKDNPQTRAEFMAHIERGATNSMGI